MDTRSPMTEVRDLLRESLRGYLTDRWSVARGRAAAADDVTSIWNGLVGQGVSLLGADDSGLSEIVVAMAELGRAGCPAPLWSAALVNLALQGSDDGLLAAIQDGTARVAFSFGARDRDAGSIALDGKTASGRLRFVEAAASCTHLVVALAADDIAIVPLDHTGVTITPTRAMGAWGLFEVELRNVPAKFVLLPARRLDDLQLEAKLALIARAHGAVSAAFEGAVAYARERKQFGQQIGKFQAIQHKLADVWIALEGVRLTLDHAADLRDSQHRDWCYFASAAIAFAGDALRRVALETQHTYGAIGYAEEHDASHHFKRVHLDTVALGGAAQARKQIAAYLFDDGGNGLPQYDLGEAGNAFRDQLQQWLDDHWTGERKAAFAAKPFAKREFDANFASDIGVTGWIGLGWPQQFGGQGRSPLEQLAFMETMERAEAPRIGAAIQSNALMMFGTPEQQKKYLPEILRGEAMHGMGYSEPQAGSDLAALRTSAVHDGDEWVINGQKIWTTTWWGKYMFLAARTDKNASPPHAGISMFIVPMDAKGITVQPATTMYDGTFANIFYDDVRIPLDHLVGEVNGGWKVLTGALAFERGLVGGGIVLKVVHAFEQLRHHVHAKDDQGHALADDPVVRDTMARLASEIEVGRQLMMHCAERAADGVTPPDIGAMSKVFSGELMERFGEAALDILGQRATLSEQMPGAIDNGRFEQNLRHSLMWVISIGTNEIQRSLIAQRGLGLPR